MNKKLFMSSLIGLLLFVVSNLSAQELDSVAVKRIVHLQERLKVTEQTAKEVSRIMISYKQATHALLADTALSQDQKNTEMEALAVEKNRKLALLLTPSQLEKIIPKNEQVKQDEQTSNPLP